jgi:hypothetical protein
MASDVQNVSFYWSFNLTWGGTGTIKNSTLHNQTDYRFVLNVCNATYSTPFINLTFKDENNGTALDGTISSSLWEYWIGGGNGSAKTLSFSNLTANANYTFCGYPNTIPATLGYNSTISYASASYPLRNVVILGNLTNVSTSKILYLLSSTSGIYVTFQTINSVNQPITNVYINIERQIGGVWIGIYSGYTDAAGSLTAWLNPNVNHKITASKTGYITYSVAIYPTQPLYTIVMSTSIPPTNITVPTEGIWFGIDPIQTVLNNGTLYRFNYNITSGDYILQQYGFVLKNGTGTILGSDSGVVVTGGNTSVTINTGNNESIIMYYYWKTGGVYNNGTRTWTIYESYEGNFSVKYFFDDLKRFAGINGMNPFTLALIAFAVILLITGLISYASGIYSPLAIGGEIVGLTWLFYWAGLIPTLTGAPIGNIIPMAITILYVVYIIWENMR